MTLPFIVVVTNPGDDNTVIKRIQDQPDSYRLTAEVWLVRSRLLIQDLADKLGIGEEQVGTGVVFRLIGSYWGDPCRTPGTGSAAAGCDGVR